ncbi:biopolymer transporter ExbD [Marivirga harenae]|uniref:ExbD/TolR family protein n=1 Tax=Marivirga harenae TaxID=2010992 RepID=UPI0026DEE512|nr:biopolymer transporter ExbD [Marivirga harenae]WKV11567.1 biopolymer transporter ExbD [Marivirga harenae]|tara:strand:- start:59247 stop:59822 length:576 start_codon:yes stop_codon:yes gene_type:complete
MARSKGRATSEVNAGSMADIAFLLLIFFLVTTTIASDKGLTLTLPPEKDDAEEIDVKIKERNLFKVAINSADRLLVEGERLDDYTQIKEMLIEHVLNPNENPELAESPQDAIVSFKTDRGTSYEIYINVLDQLQGAYYQIYADRAGITAEEYRALNLKDPKEQALYDKGKGQGDDEIPMAISIAEPTNIGG